MIQTISFGQMINAILISAGIGFLLGGLTVYGLALMYEKGRGKKP